LITEKGVHAVRALGTEPERGDDGWIDASDQAVIEGLGLLLEECLVGRDVHLSCVDVEDLVDISTLSMSGVAQLRTPPSSVATLKFGSSYPMKMNFGTEMR
jgi:hypothetical protein